MARYSADDKRKIVDYHLATDEGVRRLSRHFGVDPSHTRNWLRLDQHHGYDVLTKRFGH